MSQHLEIQELLRTLHDCAADVTRAVQDFADICFD